MNLTLVSCSYNTPEVTMNMINSFKKYHPTTPILISENSNNENTTILLEEMGIDYIRNAGFHHSIGVDSLIDHCKTEYILLVDTDVLFLSSINPLYHKIYYDKISICGVMQGNRGGLKLHNRICPWFCFINIEQLKSKNIKFFDSIRFSQHLTEQKTEMIYDVGATLLEDVINNNMTVLPITESIQDMYIKHFEGMSWRKDSKNLGLELLAEQTELQYKKFLKENII